MTINLFKMMGQRLDYINQQQRLVTQNLANLYSPEYTAKELMPLNFSSTMHAERLNTTHPAHFHAASRGAKEFPMRTINYDKTHQDNNVILQKELVKANQAGADHLQMSNLYRLNLDLIDMALQK